MILYIYPKCSTCKKALALLQENKIVYEVKEIHVTPPSQKELEAMLKFQGRNLKKLINTSGLLYREMNLSEKLTNMSIKEVLSLLSSEGMLVKRPFLIDQSFGLTGFKIDKWAKLTNS